MDITKRKKELVERFNKAIIQRNQLTALIEQIRGAVALLEEQEKENKETK